jgi:hypothetical protein
LGNLNSNQEEGQWRTRHNDEVQLSNKTRRCSIIPLYNPIRWE